MLKIILTKGLPASGKTTWTKAMQIAHPGEYKNVCKDDLRAMLDNGVWSKANEKFLLKVRNFIVEEALKEGKNVIVSDTHLAGDHKSVMDNIASRYKAQVEEKSFLDVSVEDCLVRDRRRANSVGDHVIMRMHKGLTKTDSRKPLNPLVFNEDNPSCVIFDIDGTLACINGRDPYDASKCGSDLVNESVKTLLDSIYDTLVRDDINNRLFLFSGRHEGFRKATEDWLEKNNIQYDSLWMRKEGDKRKDSIVKRELFDQIIRDKYNVLFVVDDRKQVVEMWRELGITVLQCDEGDF